ncbi:hypothetical protein CEUSTIGMA_g2817.t1 [Chlamydomonas eustigma]|uniref:Uncharacterized protein n=1 Tax=Chlamydomonas eustigma TaxID=1157962 RepID=A0A250WX08_9CHLO|nr:hypothetical protein CEUSTIGMA_g2817.t1 [Chlamydomonas eustigma]|eukprot:GAX75373.1 hypothetical protein CEUSTIGMA_g2817.t1 [Chlamydomonas eustigma]
MIFATSAPLTSWSIEENKKFEKALAQHFHDEDRWTKISEHCPHKQIEDIIGQFEKLKMDLTRIQGSQPSALGMNKLTSQTKIESLKRAKTEPMDIPEQPRKGVSWTQQEHQKFLEGLEQYGKGNWRAISRDFVISRTPTQVASHAQKYFLRVTNTKSKRRSSIHDLARQGSYSLE